MAGVSKKQPVYGFFRSRDEMGEIKHPPAIVQPTGVFGPGSTRYEDYVLFASQIFDIKLWNILFIVTTKLIMCRQRM